MLCTFVYRKTTTYFCLNYSQNSTFIVYAKDVTIPKSLWKSTKAQVNQVILICLPCTFLYRKTTTYFCLNYSQNSILIVYAENVTIPKSLWKSTKTQVNQVILICVLSTFVYRKTTTYFCLNYSQNSILIVYAKDVTIPKSLWKSTKFQSKLALINVTLVLAG